MDNIYHNLTSFLAIWFRNLQKSTYNVNVVNKEADKVSPLLYEKLQAILFLLRDLEGKELKVKVSNQKELNTKELENRLSDLLDGIRGVKLDNSTVEKLLSDLISLSKGVKKVEVLNPTVVPDKMSITGKVEVSNLPKVQEVKGDFNLKESKDILNALSELAAEIRDLKLESIQGYKNIGSTFMGTTGSREAHKLTDGTKTATITTSGDSNALDVNIVAGGAGNGAILDGADSSIKATVKDLTNANPVTVAIVDGSGDQITSFGGGTQYTEGATDASITGTALLWEDTGNTLATVSAANPLPVLASIDTTGLATATKQDTIIGHVDGIETLLTTIDADTSNISTKIDTIAGDTTAIETAVQLIDDTVATLGTDTYSEATTKGLIIGAVRRDADTTLVNTTNEITPLQVDASGRLKVEAFSGETLPVSLTSTTVTGTVAVTQSGTWDEVGINDSGNSITVDNGGTFAVQVDGAALTALQLIDDTVATTASAITSKGLAVSGTDGTNARVLKTDSSGELQVDVLSMPTVTVTATNLDVQSGGADLATSTQGAAIQTATELIDDAIYIDDADWTADTSKHALVGGVTQVTPSANTDGDTTPLITNALRELRIAPMETDMASAGGSHVHKPFSYTGAQTDAIIWSPAAGKRFHITDYGFVVSAACTVTFEDDRSGGDVSIGIGGSFAANSGKESPGHATPIFSGEDAADLVLTTSAGNIEGYVSGYEL